MNDCSKRIINISPREKRLGLARDGAQQGLLGPAAREHAQADEQAEQGARRLDRIEAGRNFAGALFAGQERRIWVTLAVEGDALGAQELGRFTLAYTDQHRRRELGFASTPLVTRVADRGQYFRSIDKRSYDLAVKQEGYGRLQQSVSDYVRRGDFAQANEAIDAFVDDHEGFNLHMPVSSEVIAEVIARARDLKGSVGGAASSPEAQNAFGKKNSYEARELRRQGGPK